MDIERFTRCDLGRAEKKQLGGVVKDGGQGPIDLVREALKILQDPYHICTFALIQSIIVVPSTFVALLTQWFEYEVIHKLVLQPPAPPAPWPDMWVVFLVLVALSLGGFVLAVNLVAAIWYSAGSMYSGKNVSFKQVIQALPGLWKKLGITAFWGHAFYLFLFIAFFVISSLIHSYASVLILPLPVLLIITVILASLVLFFINTTLQLAYGVTIYEEEDCRGLPAFVRALTLAKNQWYNALGLLVISDLPATMFGSAFTFCMLSTLDPGTKCVVAGFLIFMASVFRNLSSVTYALFYFSTKSCHNENINFEAIADRTQFEAGYQSIGGGGGGGGSAPC